MSRLHIIVYAALLALSSLSAQEIFSERIKGLHVYGSSEDRPPVAFLDSNPITIEFDVDEVAPPDLQLRFYHCDKNWKRTETSFINDEFLNRVKVPLPYTPAPAGVQFYRFHYTINLPGPKGAERFLFSGNYEFEIRDEKDKEVLANGRFFVVENTVAPVVRVTNRLLPSEVNPYTLVHKVEIAWQIPDPDSLEGAVLYPLYFTTVDVYRNRQLYMPRRIDVDDRDVHTFTDGLGTRRLRYVVDNVMPGNSYRQIDLRSVDEYPAGQLLRARRGADVSRFLKPPGRDHFGASLLTRGTRYSDYLPFQFELLWDARPPDSVFVVGDFTGWRPSENSLMTLEAGTNRYVWKTWLRRGVYDYQYVRQTGDWVTLEGNDWRTVNLYTVVIYYRDDRYGGFDRIVGWGQSRSNGGNSATSF